MESRPNWRARIPVPRRSTSTVQHISNKSVDSDLSVINSKFLSRFKRAEKFFCRFSRDFPRYIALLAVFGGFRKNKATLRRPPSVWGPGCFGGVVPEPANARVVTEKPKKATALIREKITAAVFGPGTMMARFRAGCEEAWERGEELWSLCSRRS